MPIDWGALDHALGNAGNVPELFRRLAKGEDVIDELWTCLCHQGSIYSASRPALALLAKAISNWSGEPLATPLILAAAILAPADVRSYGHVPEPVPGPVLGKLRALANHCLQSYRPGDVELPYLGAAIVILMLWPDLPNVDFDRYLGLCSLDCRECHRPLILEREGMRLFAWCGELNDLEMPDVRPKQGQLGNKVAATILELGQQYKEPRLERMARQLEGEAKCPHCGAWHQVVTCLGLDP